MAKPVVFVIGSTGLIGTATVSSLSGKYGDKLEIRAGVRNPDKADKLKALANVTVVKAEMGSSELQATLKGVDALYIVVPGAENRAELSVKTAEAAKAAGVKFLLVVSVLTADLTDTIFGKHFNEVESKVSALGVPHCFLRLPYFMDNLWGAKDTIKGASTIYSPVDPTKPFTQVTVADAGNAGAVILASVDRHAGKTYNLVSDRVTEADTAKAFSEVLGRDIKFERVTYDQAKQGYLGFGLPEWKVDGIMELFKLFDSGSPVTNPSDISAYETITGEKPTTLKAWVASVAGGFQ